MQFVDIRAKEDVQRDTEIKDERGGESKSKGDSEEEFSSSLEVLLNFLSLSSEPHPCANNNFLLVWSRILRLLREH